MPLLPFSKTHFMATPPVIDSLVAQTRVFSGRMSLVWPRSGQNHMPVRFSVSPCGMDSGVKVNSAPWEEPTIASKTSSMGKWHRQIMTDYLVGETLVDAAVPRNLSHRSLT